MNAPVYDLIDDDIQARNFYICHHQLSRENKGYLRIRDIENPMKYYMDSTGNKPA